MTFKEYQEKYIAAYKKQVKVDEPKKMFDDLQEIYDIFCDKLVILKQELAKATNWKDIKDLCLAIDDVNGRCYNALVQYRNVAKAVMDYNAMIDNSKKEKKS